MARIIFDKGTPETLLAIKTVRPLDSVTSQWPVQYRHSLSKLNLQGLEKQALLPLPIPTRPSHHAPQISQ